MLKFSFSLRFLLLSFVAAACGMAVYLGTDINGLGETDNDFDVAITGEGYFQVYDQEGDCCIHFTRTGKLKVNSEGQLCLRDQKRDLKIEPAICVPTDCVKLGVCRGGEVIAFCGSPSRPSPIGCLQLARFESEQDITEESSGIFALAPNVSNCITSNPGSNGCGFVQQGWINRHHRVGNHWFGLATFLLGMLICVRLESKFTTQRRMNGMFS